MDWQKQNQIDWFDVTKRRFFYFDGGKNKIQKFYHNFSHRGPRGWLLFLPIYLHNKSLLIFLRNGYVLFYYCSNILARVKAVELRQKNRDELLTQIEEYKKELSQVILVYSMNNQFSSVLLK